MINALTIDVEDYFHVHAFSAVIRCEDWCQFDCRVERNTDRLLEILNGSRSTPDASRLAEDYLNPSLGAVRAASSSVKATFFILGWIAERYPGLVRRIKAEGHEIACHGYAHQCVYDQSKEEFRKDIRKAKDILEEITGSEVAGYRAPSYSITKESVWALEMLAEEGFKYDSSIFPIHHDFYGFPTAPRFPFVISLNGNHHLEFSMLNVNWTLDESSVPAPGSFESPSASRLTPNVLIEFPLSTARLFGQNIPIAGGGYFRLFPYDLLKRGLKRINEVEKQPFIFYVHPWELDSLQPRVRSIGLKSRFRHYVNLDKTEGKLKRLLRDFNFLPVKEVINAWNINSF